MIHTSTGLIISLQMKSLPAATEIRSNCVITELMAIIVAGTLIDIYTEQSVTIAITNHHQTPSQCDSLMCRYPSQHSQ